MKMGGGINGKKESRKEEGKKGNKQAGREGRKQPLKSGEV